MSETNKDIAVAFYKRPCSKAGSKMPSGFTLLPPIASTIR
jgi:hypothetical protein